MELLTNCVRWREQYADFDGSKAALIRMLDERFSGIDFSDAKRDVIAFIPDASVLDE
ncbi:MAG: hypothetical protein LUD29_05635 [Clostridia bacterium]|nr:hypothetical protein [Clostridia bacterium]